jgi:hypothetical protein
LFHTAEASLIGAAIALRAMWSRSEDLSERPPE